MAYEFKLPDIGEGVVEGEIVEWLVKVGDVVKEDQPLVAVMTDKATVEIPSPKAGKVLSFGGKAGEIVKVGAMLITLDAPSGGAAAAPASAPAEAPAATAAAPAPVAPAAKAAPAAAPASAPRSAPVSTPPAAPAPARPAPAPVPAPAAASSSSTLAGPVLASPATRRLAREMGVDLGRVAGTGSRGRVLSSDIEAAAAEPPRPVAAPQLVAASAGPAAAKAPAQLLAIPTRAPSESPRTEERVPLRGMRKKIAERMALSKRTAAHFAYVDECDVTELVKLRERLKPVAARYGVNLTYLPFILKALVPCLREFPLLNSTLDEESSELVLKHYWNIGIAIDTDAGLTVPVVKDVDKKSVLEIAAEMTELSNRARANRLKMEDIQGGTFTVTSTGNIGGLFATPIINYPEVAILGVPKIKPRPMVVDGQIVVRDVLYLALSLDHRVVDGAVAARFMNSLIEYLSDPGKLFLELA